jgi:hypothetical protein
MQMPLPDDFLEKTPLAEIKRIARERNYDMKSMRMLGSPPKGTGVVPVILTDVLMELCQSPDLDRVETGVEIIAESGPKWNPAMTAAMIASSHKEPFVEKLILKYLEQEQYRDLVVSLIQEEVLRGSNFESNTRIADFWKRLDNAHYPLGWLPLHSADAEKGVTFKQYSGSGSAVSMPSTSVSGELPQKTDEHKGAPALEVKPAPIDEAVAARCVKSWVGANVEAAAFTSRRPIAVGDISRNNLLSLGMKCFAGATDKDVHITPASPDRVFAILYSASANGGPYSGGGEHAAQGRLAAWQSMGAVCGAPPGSDFESVSTLANNSKWMTVECKSKWFYNIAWDLAVVCVRPDGHHIAILAASTED